MIGARARRRALLLSGPARIVMIALGCVLLTGFFIYRGFPYERIGESLARSLSRSSGARVTIEGLRGDGDHYAALVVSAAFKGKTRVQQHQMVYDALQDRMGTTLHALALQTSVPEDA